MEERNQLLATKNLTGEEITEHIYKHHGYNGQLAHRELMMLHINDKGAKRI